MAKRKRKKRGSMVFATLLFLLTATAVTIYLVNQQQDLRQRASETGPANTIHSLNENPCDISDDEDTNATDYALLIKCVQNTTSCTQNTRNRSDLNNDGEVNALDLNLFRRDCSLSSKEN